MAQSNLINHISELLGAKADNIEERMDSLDIDQMLSLVDAVAGEDASRVREIIGDGVQENSDEDVPRLDRKSRKSKNRHRVEEGDYVASIGDAVSVDGKDAIVKIARGPSNTVGVMIDGELTMVNRSKVRPLTEQVLGMTMMPDLNRMRELAGIMSSEDSFVDAQSVPVETIEIPFDTDLKKAIDTAIDQIEALLPKLRVGDYKEVSQRIMKTLNVINEAFRMPVGVLKESAGNRLWENHETMLDRLESVRDELVSISGTLGKNQSNTHMERELISAITRCLRSMSATITSLKLTDMAEKRRSFKDYVSETEATQTIGNNRPEAVKNLQTRMGDGTTPQQASKAFDRMRATGKIKQNGTKLTMPAMGDDDLKGAVGGNSGTH